MAITALVLIVRVPGQGYPIAALIFGSVLLDWVDGPAARHFGQSTVMGCGWDWLGDILAQYCLAIWCMQKETQEGEDSMRLFVVLFTTVELATGLFDFAVSAQSMYPCEDTDKLPWWCVVERWLTPGGSYNKLGIFGWLANTLFPIAYCLDMPSWTIYFLAPFAILYAWHEVVQACFIISSWQETTAVPAGGLVCMRGCTDEEINVLKDAWEQNKSLCIMHESNEKEIYWVNLFLDGIPHPKFSNAELQAKFHLFVSNLIEEMYTDRRSIKSYGFIIAPKNGDKDQKWHIDYSSTCSNLFVPMTKLTHRNATQFIRHPGGSMTALYPDESGKQVYADPHELLASEKTNYLEVSQVVSEPFVVLKLFPGCVHRGVANREDFDRVTFWVTTDVIGSRLDLCESFEKQFEFNKQSRHKTME
jgi:phosphatidylglycerophosphate synthase